VRVGPSIAAAKTANDNIALSVVPIRLDGSATVAGSGPVRIETRMRWSSPSSLDGEYDQASLTIEAGDPVTAGAWERAFGEVRQRAQSEGVNPLWLPIERVGNTVTLSIQPPTDKKVVLSVYPASYTATVRNAASLME
jgi:hypothetical protein